MSDKLVFVVTHGPENAERASLPFVLAAAAQASGAEVFLVFQFNGVFLLRKGMIEHVPATGFAPLPDLLDVCREGGIRLLACVPCLKERRLAAEDLIDGCELVNAGTVVTHFLDATNVVVY